MHKASSQPTVRPNLTQHYMSIILIRIENICICLYKNTALKILNHKGFNFFKAILKFYLGPRILGDLCRPFFVCVRAERWLLLATALSVQPSGPVEKYDPWETFQLCCIRLCFHLNFLWWYERPIFMLILNPFFTLATDHLKYGQYDLKLNFQFHLTLKLTTRYSGYCMRKYNYRENKTPNSWPHAPWEISLASSTRCLHSSP